MLKNVASLQMWHFALQLFSILVFRLKTKIKAPPQKKKQKTKLKTK